MRISTEYLSPVWPHLTPIQPQRAQGIYIYDVDGMRYMDFTSGIGVTNTGHCHPKVVEAIQSQAERLIFGQMNIVIPAVSASLAAELDAVTPANIDSYFISNSGAEAVEASVKLSRHATGKRNIVVFHGSFHGRTAQTMAMSTSKTIYRHDYSPLPSGVFVAPYPYSFYYGWDEEQTTDFCLRELDKLFHSQTPPEETAAIIIETVLGEGGYVPAPDRFIQELRTFCTKNEILLIVDEVQCGFGRTGKFFAYEYSGIEPDIIVMAKALGSGVPISGIAANRDLMNRWEPGSHGGTYGGGSAICAAAALATLKVINEESLVQNSSKRGNQLLSGLQKIKSQFPVLGDVRGRGLMVGTEFTKNGKPDTETTKAMQKLCLDDNLILLTCGTYENVIRWIPPLVVSAEQIDEALSIFEAALKKINS